MKKIVFITVTILIHCFMINGQKLIDEDFTDGALDDYGAGTSGENWTYYGPGTDFRAPINRNFSSALSNVVSNNGGGWADGAQWRVWDDLNSNGEYDDEEMTYFQVHKYNEIPIIRYTTFSDHCYKNNYSGVEVAFLEWRDSLDDNSVHFGHDQSWEVKNNYYGCCIGNGGPYQIETNVENTDQLPGGTYAKSLNEVKHAHASSWYDQDDLDSTQTTLVLWRNMKDNKTCNIEHIGERNIWADYILDTHMVSLLDPDNEYSLFSYVQITFFRGISSEPSSDWLLRDDATFTEAQIGITQLELGVIKISDFNIDYQTNEMDADTLIKYIGNKEENAHLLTGDATNNDTVNLFDANPLTGFWSATTPTPTASGTYNQSTGEIVLSLNDISYFHLEGPAGIFNGSAPNLSAFTNDISIDNNNNIGAFTKSSWNVSNQSIGNVAATSYNPTDLYLVFNYKGSGEREGIKIPLDGTIYTANKKVSYSDANITITPNPAHDIIYIQSDLNEIIEIAIYTITGTQVLTLKTTLNKQIDISNLSPGVYNISITSDKVNETQKLIVK